MESECCALAGTDCRPTALLLRASRPQLKRDPLGGGRTFEEVHEARSTISGATPRTLSRTLRRLHAFSTIHRASGLHAVPDLGRWTCGLVLAAGPGVRVHVLHSRVMATKPT